VVKEERRQRYDNVPYGDSVEYLIALAFPPDHPYGHSTIGSMADLDLATRSSAADFFTRHYRPDNAVLTICGDITAAAGFRAAERYFASIPSLDYPKRPPVKPLPGLAGIPRSVVRGNVPAAAVSFVWRLPVANTPEYDAVSIAMAILGQGLTSRFYRNLVQTEISQGAQAGTLGLVGGNSFGFAQALALPPTSPERLEEAMVAEVEQLLHLGPDDAEVERVKIQLLRQFLSGLADLGTRADAISGSTLLFDDPTQINRRLSELAKISSADVSDACANYLDPDTRGVLVYLPEDDNGNIDRN
jgi:predicted Zn-dependent peptidase